MEYLGQWEFWQEVGLTVAARLSVIAAALWAVKMVTDRLKKQPATPSGLGELHLPAVSRSTAISRLPKGRKVKKSSPLKEHYRPLTLIKPRSDSWKEKMGKYLSGEPVVSAGSPPKPRGGN